MKVYFASNFVLMRYIEQEKKFRKEITKRYGECNRLFSYFFQKEIKKVVQLAKEEHNLK